MSGSGVSGGMGGGLVPGMHPPPSSMRPSLVGQSWAVVGGHPLTSMVAAEIFDSGGNAVDAGVAAGIASNVVQVDMANFGGIAPIAIRRAGSPSVHAIAGVGRWSRSVTLQALLDRYGGTLPLDGAPAIVPGAPAGWLRALREFGTMTLSEVASQAITLARQGFLLDQATATSLSLAFQNFSRWSSSVDVYAPGNRAFVVGERLRQPALADTLQRLVDAEQSARGSREEGIIAAHDAFYRGEIPQIISQWVREHGGYLEEEDFSSFEAEVDDCDQTEVGDWSMWATPSWSQGPTALEILGLIARGNQSLHHTVQATTLAFNDREDFFCEPVRMAPAAMELLSAERLDSLAGRMTQRALPGRSGETPVTGLASTTAVVTIDREGNVFAASPSDTIDGGPVIPELGILCSPRGVQSRLNPDHPNRVMPGGRPCVTPAAMIGLRDGDAWALACPGGDVIVQAMAQVAWSVISGLTDLQQAVEEPRVAAFNAPSAFHPHPSAENYVYAESRIPSEAIEHLRNEGHTIELWPDFAFDAGSVQTVMSCVSPSGDVYLKTGSDPRRSAYAVAK